MHQPLEPRVRSLLETVPVGVVATQRRDGRARQSTVHFVLDGDTIWISTEAARAKALDVEGVYGISHLPAEESA